MRYLLHNVFQHTVQRVPQRIAVHEESGQKTTYTELNALANQFAQCFRTFKSDVRQQPYVGILATVHTKSIAACLGILKIGGTYVPLDEHSPSERLLKIIENTRLDTIVVDEHLAAQYAELFASSHIAHIIVLGNHAPVTQKAINMQELTAYSNDEPPLLNQVSDDLAYILHSSGSTGVPKGIMLTHRNARTFVDWMQKEFQLTENDVVMSRAPFKFDLSVFDIFNTFNAGATLVCYDWSKPREGDSKHADYVRVMQQQKATILYTTPSTFIALMNRGGLAKADLPLREIMYAGEPFPTPQLRRLHQALPNTRIANIYGPTETNIITYYWVDNFPENDAPIPLGHVVEDTEILVIDDAGTRQCEPSEMGELWCRGGTVTVGYLGMEEKTKACIAKSPVHAVPTYFWRTGDYGYHDEAGLLHYKGRKDHMIKVKGFRIELGEVESALAKMPELDEFVVVAVPDEKYGNRLYCYFVVQPGATISQQTVRDFLASKLPEYMIPYRFFQETVLPKTSSGKIDRVQLAERTTL